MNSTEGLEDQQTRILHEFLGTTDEEEVVVQDIGAIAQLLLSSVEVEMNVETLEELGDRISKGVGLLKPKQSSSLLSSLFFFFSHLLNDFDQLFQRSFVLLSRIDDHRRGEITQQVRRGGLQRVQIGVGLVVVRSSRAEKQLNEIVATFGMIEIDEQRPVNEPSALMQQIQRRTSGVRLDRFFQLIQIVIGIVPTLHQDLRGEFPPQTRHHVLVTAGNLKKARLR